MEDEYDVQTLISFQRKELMSAKKLETDMDLAFNLQMQEAIAASQILSPQKQPSSSSNSLQMQEAMATEIPSAHFTDAILREIDNYEQERSDFEQSKSEMEKLKQNLRIQLHDQKYASEILRISDHDWQNYGDNFEIPYSIGCGSSSSSSSSSCLRMYFKGIVDTDGRKKVGAVGVAICDPMDNLIFEVSKAVVDVEDREMSEERVEFEALVVGFDAALALDLKRVEYFCDNFMFYQAVIGRRPPTEYSIANIIERVNLLQKGFVQCTPHLITRSDVKFAFRLARASMSSQLLKLATCNSGNYVQETCSICYEDRVSKLMFSVDGCGHRFCSFCIEQHLEAKLLIGSLPKCPSEGCKSGISIERCQKLLAPKLLDIMGQRVKEATIPATEKVYCPNPTCSMLMSISEVQEYSRTAVVRLQEPGSSRCIKCHELFCIDCKVPWHSFTSCEFFRQFVQSNSANVDVKLKSLAEKKRWSQCRQCKNMIELAEGCYHITCRCGFEFCYICGAEWKNKKQTCKCRLWDERNIIRNGNGNGRRN